MDRTKSRVFSQVGHALIGDLFAVVQAQVLERGTVRQGLETVVRDHRFVE